MTVKKNPTKILGYDDIVTQAKELRAERYTRLQAPSNRGKSPTTGDVAEWLKATVC